MIHRLDAVAPVFRNEGLDPRSVISIKNQIFRTADNETIQVEDFCMLQRTMDGFELRKGQIGLRSGQVDVWHNSDSEVRSYGNDAIYRRIPVRYFNGCWVVTRKERAISLAVVQYFLT